MPGVTYDNQNIFIKILRSKLPCIKVYEDDRTIAFMDITPQADGYMLVLPKEGAVELLGLSDDAASAAVRTTCKLTRAVRATFTPPDTAVFQLNDSAAGQTMPHVYLHVLPHYSDTPLQPHTRIQVNNDRLKAQVERIITTLQAEQTLPSWRSRRHCRVHLRRNIAHPFSCR